MKENWISLKTFSSFIISSFEATILVYIKFLAHDVELQTRENMKFRSIF